MVVTHGDISRWGCTLNSGRHAQVRLAYRPAPLDTSTPLPPLRAFGHVKRPDALWFQAVFQASFGSCSLRSGEWSRAWVSTSCCENSPVVNLLVFVDHRYCHLYCAIFMDLIIVHVSANGKLLHITGQIQPLTLIFRDFIFWDWFDLRSAQQKMNF